MQCSQIRGSLYSGIRIFEKRCVSRLRRGRAFRACGSFLKIKEAELIFVFFWTQKQLEKYLFRRRIFEGRGFLLPEGFSEFYYLGLIDKLLRFQYNQIKVQKSGSQNLLLRNTSVLPFLCFG